MTKTDSQALSKIQAKLSDPWWRLNNLYYITNEKGQKIKFKPNAAQLHFHNSMWYFSIILKARQLGMTTFIQIFMLDRCLFNRDTMAGVVAHNREDAEDFFRKKIKYAYDNLPEWLKEQIPATSDSAKMLEFGNGSSIRVGTSLRSGTYQYLHISEFGKLCAKRPDHAEEIIAGTINTVHEGGFIFIESTAEGGHGRFHDMYQDAQLRTEWSKLDFKAFFYPWWRDPRYESDPTALSEADEVYFAKIENECGITLTPGQKSWYVKKRNVQKSKMLQEYPSTPTEAFEVVSEHAIYGSEFKSLREKGRIGAVPYDPSKPVHTFWDIGRSKTDSTCIWFMQESGQEFNFIDYLQDTQKPVNHYVTKIQNKGYVYANHYLPHDADHNDHEMTSYKDHLAKYGINNVIIVPRIADLTVGIDLTRQKLPLCRFDKDNCAPGILALERYSYDYDEKKGMYTQPLHNWASHPSDAFRQFAQGYKGRVKGYEPINYRRKVQTV